MEAAIAGQAEQIVHLIDNAWIESFNGMVEDECLNVYWYDDLVDA